jgi:hypothetical protein
MPPFFIQCYRENNQDVQHHEDVLVEEKSQAISSKIKIVSPCQKQEQSISCAYDQIKSEEPREMPSSGQ